jgi:hypothetical protein
VKEFTSGAKSSAERDRFDLCELVAMKRWAKRMAKGAASHGERNYQKGARDPVFIRDRVNHLIEHAMRYASGDRSDDHLGAVMANAGMLIWIEEQASKTFDDARAEPEACRCGKLVTRPEQCDGPPCPLEKRYGVRTP